PCAGSRPTCAPRPRHSVDHGSPAMDAPQRNSASTGLYAARAPAHRCPCRPSVRSRQGVEMEITRGGQPMKTDRNRRLPYSSRPVRDAIMAELEDALQHGNDRLRKIVRKMLDRAEEGELAWLLELFCRIEGRIPQAADVNVNVEPIKMIITGVPRPGDH